MGKIIGIIPARHGSSRFPGKPLVKLGNKTIIQRVYEQAEKCTFLDKICVATDHVKIFEHIDALGGNVTMTSKSHLTGTDRCYEALCNQDESFDYVVNIQGDEPFTSPEQIQELTACLDDTTQIATLGKIIHNIKTLWSPTEVKIVLDKYANALYFSRAVIPAQTENTPKSDWLMHHDYIKHIGLYAYRSDILKTLSELEPAKTELLESLEQLRWLENGFKVKVAFTDIETQCIDTPEDLSLAEKLI